MNENCPAPGRLRAWLDGEVGPAVPGPTETDQAAVLTDHLMGCPACQQALAALRADAEYATSALDRLAASPPTERDTERALASLRARLAPHAPQAAPRPAPWGAERDNHAAEGGSDLQIAPRRRPMSIAHVAHAWQRWRLAMAGLAAALALVLALATPEGQTAAAAFLAQFRSQRLQIVTFNPDQLRQRDFLRLDQVATVRHSQPARPLDVANVQEAASRVGFPVLQPDPAALPAGVSRTPKVRVLPATEARVTFDRQKARDYLDSMNRKDLSLPNKLDGATLVVSMPAVVILEYAGADNRPGLMIGEAREIQVGVDGAASLDEVRSFLLTLPGLPPDLVRQLASIQDWRTTLPIPVPIDTVAWQDTTVAGAPAFIINDNTGLGSGVIWQRDGRILGVAGPLKAPEVRRVAESLR